MKYSRFEQLPVWQKAIELAVALLELTEDQRFSGIGDIRNQLQRAVVSIGNNIAEGFERGTTQELLTFIYYAKGSAGEVRSMLITCERLARFVDLKSEISNLKSDAENVSRQLGGWADSLQNSELKGVRYLNDSVREQKEREERRAAFELQLKDIVEQGRLRREGERSALKDAAPKL